MTETIGWIGIGSMGHRMSRHLVNGGHSLVVADAVVRQVPGVNVDDKRVTIPTKADTYQNIEGLINHFKLIFEGVKTPVGEVYDFTEAANGELGFYIVSDGSGYGYRIRCRPPCFFNFAAFHEMIEGHMIADAVAILGSINIIAGELER